MIIVFCCIFDIRIIKLHYLYYTYFYEVFHNKMLTYGPIIDFWGYLGFFFFKFIIILV